MNGHPDETALQNMTWQLEAGEGRKTEGHPWHPLLSPGETRTRFLLAPHLSRQPHASSVPAFQSEVLIMFGKKGVRGDFPSRLFYRAVSHICEGEFRSFAQTQPYKCILSKFT